MAESVKGRVFDTVLTLLASPLVIFFWCSTWVMLSLYVSPSNPTVSASVSLAISYVFMVTSFFTQDVLNNNIRTRDRLCFLVGSRLFTYIMTLALVCNWYGMWTLLDIFTGLTMAGAGINTAVGVVGLISLRSYRNVLAPPGLWVLDVDTDTHFTMMSRFRTRKYTVLHLLDVLFGVLIISTLVVLAWRGQWMILDYFLSQYSAVWRGSIYTIAGNVFLLLLTIIQYPARRLATRLHSTSPWLQTAFEDAFIIVVCWNTVMYWVGIWTLLVTICKGYNPHLTQWLFHVVGFGGMVVLRLCTSLQFKGYYIDGEFPEGIGLVQTPTYYSMLAMTSSNIRKILENASPRDTTIVYQEEAAALQEPDQEPDLPTRV